MPLSHYKLTRGLAILLMLLLGSFLLCAEELSTIRIGFPNESGSRASYGRNFTAKLQEALPDCKLEYYAEPFSLEEGRKMVANGTLDLMGMAYLQEGDKQHFLYSPEPVAFTPTQVLGNPANAKRFLHEHTAWNDTTVACRENSYEREAFATYAIRNNITYNEKLYPTDEDVHNALLNNEVDLAVLNNSIARHKDTDTNRCVILEELESRPWYLMTRANNQTLMDKINNALDALYEKDPAWNNALVKKYFIGREVRVLFCKNGAPDVDRYSKLLLQRMEIYNSWKLVIEEYDEENLPEDLSKFDLVCGVTRNAKTQKQLDFPAFPLGNRPLYLLAQKENPIFESTNLARDFQKFTVAFPTTIPQCSEYFQFFMNKRVGYELHYYDDTEDVMEGLTKGNATLAYTDRAFPTDKYAVVQECGTVPFYIATPQGHDECLFSLDETLEYFYFHESRFLHQLSRQLLSHVAPKGQVVRVAIYREVGLAEINDDGSLSGYTLDYIRRIAELAGWTLEELPTNYVNAQKYVAEGLADILLCAIVTPERKKVFNYSQFDIGPLYYGLMTPAKSPLKPNRPDTWQGARIGFLRGSKSVLDLTQFLVDRKVSWSPVPYDNLEKAEQHVREGKIDAVYTLMSRHSQDLEPLAMLPTELTYICTTKKKPELVIQINMAMAEIHRHERNFQNTLSELYFPGNQNVLMVNPEDLKAIEQRQGKPIYVDLFPLISPLKEYDRDVGTAVGFIKNLCREITETTGLRFLFLPPVSEQESRKRLVLGECDIWFGYGATQQETDHLPCIRDALKTQAAIIRRQGYSSMNATNNETVAIAKSDTFLLERFKNSNQEVLICDDRLGCYQAVANHQADLTYDALQVASVTLLPGKTKFPSLAFQPVDQQSLMLPFPVYFSAHTDPQILNLLAKAIQSIPREKENDFLFEAVFGKQQPLLSGKQLLFILGMILFLGLLILVLILAYFNKQLTQERDNALEAKKAQQDADTKRMEQEAANKAKSAFLFNMSHDIRTPMNAITGYTAMAQKQLQDTRKVGNYLEKIAISSKHLLELINGVLDMSRIEAGKMTLNETPCDIREIGKALLVICASNAQKKGVRLNTVFDEIKHPVVIADALRLNQVVLNILSNAIKYTPAGGTVTMKVTEIPCQNPDEIGHEVVVTDTGLGMSEEFQKQLFVPFSREKNTTIGGIEGTGLGLAIVKRIMDLMNADIHVESKQGVGTTVTMRFHYKIAKNALPQEQSKQNYSERALLKGKKVLLVEDNAMNREIAREMLQEFGLVVEEANDGDVAVLNVMQNAPGYYNLVLMDVQMPRMNGYEATRQIRKVTAQSDFKLPIIAMTANAFAEDKQDALNAGMDAHLAKPINEDEVLQTLLKFI